MSQPTISILTPHWNRPDHLRDYLQSLAGQTYPNFELLLHDDGTEGPNKQIVMQYVEEYGAAAHLERFLEHERKYPEGVSDIGPGLAQWSKMYNRMFPHSKGEIVGILSSDWKLKPDFLEVVARELEEMGSGNMVFGDVPGQRETKLAQPDGATTGAYLVKYWYAADTRNQNFVWREDWQEWDESFDEYGFGHAMPFWLFQLFVAGVKMWVSLDMHADENDHKNPPEFTEQVNSSTAHYEKKRAELLGK